MWWKNFVQFDDEVAQDACVNSEASFYCYGVVDVGIAAAVGVIAVCDVGGGCQLSCILSYLSYFVNSFCLNSDVKMGNAPSEGAF